MIYKKNSLIYVLVKKIVANLKKKKTFSSHKKSIINFKRKSTITPVFTIYLNGMH